MNLFIILWLVSFSQAQSSFIDQFKNDIAWRPNTNEVARSYEDGRLEIIDATSRSVVFSKESLPLLTQIAWNFDGSLLAVGTTNLIEIWDVTNNQLINTLVASPISGTFNSDLGTNQEIVVSLSWNNANQLLSLSLSGVLRTWNPVIGQQMLDLEASSAQMFSADWNQDSSSIVSVRGLGVVHIDPNTGNIENWAENTYAEFGTAIDWNLQGTEITIGTSTGYVIIHDGTQRTRTPLEVISLGNLQINDLQWSPDNTRLVVAEDKKLHIYHYIYGTVILLQTTEAIGRISSVAWSPDGTQVAFIDENAADPFQIVAASKPSAPASVDGCRCRASYH